MLATGMPIANAIATSLVAITIFGVATSANYAWSGLVEWNIATNFVAGGIVGGIVGTLLQSRLVAQKALLNSIFACFVVAIGCFVIFKGV
jgi:uncharacterized protein